MFVQLLLFLCSFLFYLWFKKRNKGLPPGPVRLPIVGSVIQLFLANSRYPYLALAKLADKYGGIMTIGFGMRTAVVVSSYEIMKHVFRLTETNSHRFEFPFVTDRSYGKNLGIVFSHGKVWLNVRKFTMKALKEFGYGKPKIMDQSLTDSANQLVDSIKMELSDSADWTYFVDSHKLTIHIVNVLWNMVGGYKFEPHDELLKTNLKLADKFIEIASHANPYNIFPFLKDWFPNQMRYPEHLETLRQLNEFMKTLINDVKEKRSLRFDSEPTSLIELFLDKIEMHRGDSDTIFTQEQLELVLNDLFLAGTETTGTLLNWSMLFLTLNPDKQSKLRRHIIDNIGNSPGILHSIELQKIPYLRAVLLETFRMGNVSSTPSPRLVMSDVKIQDYLIPKGTMLLLNLHPMLNDKTYWKDPENFRPERYFNEFGEIDQELAERVMSVFGFGARVCFGEALGVATLFIFLATLVMNFEFHSILGQEPSAENPRVGITISPREYSVRITNAKI